MAVLVTNASKTAILKGKISVVEFSKENFYAVLWYSYDNLSSDIWGTLLGCEIRTCTAQTIPLESVLDIVILVECEVPVYVVVPLFKLNTDV